MTPLRAALLTFAIGTISQTSVASDRVRATLPLTSAGDVTERIDKSLTLHIQGDENGFWIEVNSDKRVPRCHPNLAHWAPHGPDPSDVLPWHVATAHYPNVRSIPICGYPLTLDVEMSSVRISGQNESATFAEGTLVVTVTKTRIIKRNGT
jgi:hypothetical protein